MADRFLITGLPRSRTGWLSVLFNYGRSFCFHDGIALGVAGLEAKMREVYCDMPWLHHIGNADSGWLMFAQPKSTEKVIVVRRNLTDAAHSFWRYFSEHPYPQATKFSLANALDAMKPLEQKLQTLIQSHPREMLRVVEFDDLNRMDVCESLWDFIVPEEKFDKHRWAVLDKLKVNPQSEKVMMLWE